MDSATSNRSWARANCIGLDVEMFFPTTPQDEAAAKAVCAGCPVRQACLDRALASGVRHGVWGGLTTDERIALRTRRHPSARTVRAPRHLTLVR